MGAPDSMPQIWVGIVLGLFQVALILSTAELLGMDSGPRESHQQRGVEFSDWKWASPKWKGQRDMGLGVRWEALSICCSQCPKA